MGTKTIKTRIINKHDIEKNWDKAKFIPMKGELIIYDPDENYSYAREKIGDGVNYVKDLPFINENKLVSGDGKDSTINSITYPDTEYRENEGISSYSTALGVSNIAGSLAFNIAGYSTDDKTYTLSSALPETATNFKTGELEAIDVGAEYTVILPSVNRNFHGTITAIDSTRTIVTVSNLEIGNGGSDWNDTSRCYFKLVNYPLAGDVATGSAAAVFGEANVASEFASYASGYLNNADGKYAIAIGRQNEAAWSCAAIGSRNEAHGLGSFALGLDNKTSAMGATALNQYNNSKHQRALVAGIGNNSSASNQTVLGQYNEDNSNALLIIGNGTGNNGNVTSRSNAFTVLKDGRAVIAKDPVNNMDVSNKQYVEKRISDVDNSCKKYVNDSISNIEVENNISTDIILGKSPVSIEAQDAGTKMDLKFSYSDPIETDITYVSYTDNLLIKQTQNKTLKNISTSTILKCNEYGVMTFPIAVNSGGTFFPHSYNKNGLLPLATSGKITIALHINDATFENNAAIQLRCDIWYEDANKEIKNSSNNQSFVCKPGQVRVFDIDKFTSDFGPIVGMDYGVAWQGGKSITSEVDVYPAIYRGDVSSSINGLAIPDTLTKGNSQQLKNIANNTIESITLPSSDITSIAGFYAYGVNSKNHTIYKSFDNLVISQIKKASKIEAGENIELSFGEDGKTLIINSTVDPDGADEEMTFSDESIEGATTLKSIKVGEDSWNILPEENKQAGAFLRLDSNLNPVWQKILNAEEAAF